MFILNRDKDISRYDYESDESYNRIKSIYLVNFDLMKKLDNVLNINAIKEQVN